MKPQSTLCALFTNIPTGVCKIVPTRTGIPAIDRKSSVGAFFSLLPSRAVYAAYGYSYTFIPITFSSKPTRRNVRVRRTTKRRITDQPTTTADQTIQGTVCESKRLHPDYACRRGKVRLTGMSAEWTRCNYCRFELPLHAPATCKHGVLFVGNKTKIYSSLKLSRSVDIFIIVSCVIHRSLVSTSLAIDYWPEIFPDPTRVDEAVIVTGTISNCFRPKPPP